jgi:hypothetical protein
VDVIQSLELSSGALELFTGSFVSDSQLQWLDTHIPDHLGDVRMS